MLTALIDDHLGLTAEMSRDEVVWRIMADSGLS
jgi:hypothetical protein